MRSTLQRVMTTAGLLVAASLTSAVSAQAPAARPAFTPPPPAPEALAVIQRISLAELARVQPGQVVFIPANGVQSIGVRTTVTVPDGGTALVGGNSRVSEGRNEYGAPVVGKLPLLGRGFRNVGYGRETVTGRVSASVRVIDLREEEYRQTGYRSP